MAVQAAVSALAGAVVFAVGGRFAFFSGLLSPHLGAAVLGVVWLAQVGVLSAVDTAPGSPARAARAAALTALFAFAVVGAVGISSGSLAAALTTDGWLFVLLDGGCLAVGVLTARRGPLLGLVGLGVVGLTVAGVVLVNLPPPQPSRPSHPAPVLAAPPTPSITSLPLVPTPTPTPTRPPVDASAACAAEALSWDTVGWDAAMGTRVVSVRVENRGAEPCYLEGVPAVRLAQDGHPLQLTFDQGTPGDPFLGDPTGRVGLASGDAASFGLVWRAHPAPSPESVQSLRVLLAVGGDWSDVPLSLGPAPFDLADGARVSVGGWISG